MYYGELENRECGKGLLDWPALFKPELKAKQKRVEEKHYCSVCRVALAKNVGVAKKVWLKNFL